MESPKFKLPDIKIGAVIVGALVDNAGTVGIMLLLMSALESQNLSQDEIAARMATVSGLLLNLIIGLGCTALGGYVAGRMARRMQIVHGALVAALGLVLAAIFPEKGLPTWYDIAGYAGMLPAGMFGGYLALQWLKRHSKQPSDR